MKLFLKTFILTIGILISGATSAYTHLRELPSDFHLAKCIKDKELNEYATLIVDGITTISPKLQIIGFSHNNYIKLEKDAFLPIGPVFAYVYMCSYKNNQGYVKHIWGSQIYKDNNGKRITTYILLPESYKKQPIYKGKTYSSWNDWYNDTFFDDDEVDVKYKNINSLEYFAIENKEVYDRTMNFTGYSKTPLHKFRYVGSFIMGSKKYHAWETFAEAKYSSKFFLYTTNPNPPKFEDRLKWLEISRHLY